MTKNPFRRTSEHNHIYNFFFYTSREINRQRVLQPDWVGSGRFIVLNASASPESFLTSIEHKIKNPLLRTSEHIEIIYYQTYT